MQSNYLLSPALDSVWGLSFCKNRSYLRGSRNRVSVGEAISKLESMTFVRESRLKKKLQRRKGFDKGLKNLGEFCTDKGVICSISSYIKLNLASHTAA